MPPVSALIGLNATLPEQLHPDLMPDARGHRTTEASGDERLGNGARALRARAVGLTEADAIALGVMDDAGRGEVGREVRQRSDDAPRFDRRRDDAAGIDALEPETVELAAESSGSTTTECRSAC